MATQANMATVDIYDQNTVSKKTRSNTVMSLEEFKSKVILLLQQLINLCETEQQEAVIFLKNNIDNISNYIGDDESVITESDNSFDSVNNDNSANDVIGDNILEPFERNDRDEKYNDAHSTSKRNREELDSNDISPNKTEADDVISRTSLPVKFSKKKVTSKVQVNCAICKKNFNAFPPLLRHLIEHTGTQISCIHCKRVFNNYVLFNIHKSVCQMCRNMKGVKGSTFIFDRKNIANLQLSKVFCCPFCGENYSSGSNLRRHIGNKKCRKSDDKVSTDVVQCKYCNKISTSQVQHNEHVQNKHARSCSVCGPLIMSVRNWKSHKKRHELEQIHNCGVCSQSFRTRKLLREHLRRHGPDMKNIKKTKYPDNRHKCNECGYASNNLSNLQRHTKLKHKACSVDMKFSCHKCPMLFKLNNALKEHLTLVHSTERTLVCPLCPASFKLASSLSRHMSVHSGAKLTCACCNQRFHRHDGLKRHLRKHRATQEQTQEDILELLPPQDISILAPQPLQLAASECTDLMLASPARTELIISTPARSDLISTPARSELVSLMDLQSGEMLTLSPADYMLYLSS